MRLLVESAQAEVELSWCALFESVKIEAGLDLYERLSSIWGTSGQQEPSLARHRERCRDRKVSTSLQG